MLFPLFPSGPKIVVARNKENILHKAKNLSNPKLTVWLVVSTLLELVTDLEFFFNTLYGVYESLYIVRNVASQYQAVFLISV